MPLPFAVPPLFVVAKTVTAGYRILATLVLSYYLIDGVITYEKTKKKGSKKP